MVRSGRGRGRGRARGQGKKANTQRGRSRSRSRGPVRGRSKSRDSTPGPSRVRGRSPSVARSSGGPSGVSGSSAGGLVQRVEFRERKHFAGGLGITGLAVSMLTPKFPYAIAKAEGWGIENVSFEINWGGADMKGTARWIIRKGKASKEAFEALSSEEKWADLGKDPQCVEKNIKGLNSWISPKLPADPFADVIARWDNATYAWFAFAISVPTTSQQVSTDEFCSIIVSWHAFGPPPIV